MGWYLQVRFVSSVNEHYGQGGMETYRSILNVCIHHWSTPALLFMIQ
jgi:hypothetical protein